MALDVGASSYIAKPVEERALIQEIERWIGKEAAALNRIQIDRSLEWFLVQDSQTSGIKYELRGHHNSTNMLVETAVSLWSSVWVSAMWPCPQGIRGVLTQEEAGNEQSVTASGTIYQLVDLARRLSVVADLSIDTRTVLYSNGRPGCDSR
jgi:hypothetical protein